MSDHTAKLRVVVGAAIGLGTGFGGMVFGSLAIFLKPIAHEFGWSRAGVSSALIMSMLGLAVGAPLAGWLIERLSHRVVIAAQVVLLAALLAEISILPPNHLLFGLSWFTLGLATGATGPNGYLGLLPPLFDRWLGLSLSGAMVGIGLGGAGAAYIVQTVIQASSWRVAERDLAVAALIGGGLALLVIGRHAGAQGNTGPHLPRPGLSRRAAARDARLFQLAAAITISSACGLGITVHTAAMLDDRGFSPMRIAAAVSLSGAGVAIGRFAGGALMDVLSARAVGCAAYGAGAIGTALLGLVGGNGFGLAGAGAFLLGLALGAEGDFLAFVIRRYFGMKAFSSIYGAVFSVYAIGGIGGVILCGRAYDTLGNYHLASLISAGGFLCSAILVAALGAYRYPAVGSAGSSLPPAGRSV